MRLRLAIAGICFLMIGTSNASAFSMGFRWCGLGSPAISLSGVPKGTTTLQFQMVDLDVPSYPHGGGTVSYSGQKNVACGALNNYTPPSPPSGSHTYRISVTAIGNGGANLGSTNASRKFPEK